MSPSLKYLDLTKHIGLYIAIWAWSEPKCGINGLKDHFGLRENWTKHLAHLVEIGLGLACLASPRQVKGFGPQALRPKHKEFYFGP